MSDGKILDYRYHEVKKDDGEKLKFFNKNINVKGCGKMESFFNSYLLIHVYSLKQAFGSKAVLKIWIFGNLCLTTYKLQTWSYPYVIDDC